MKIDLIAFNCRYSHSCLALFYVRGEIKKHTSTVPTIYQFTINDPYYDTLLKITGSDADALFFSVYIWNADYIKRLIQDIKIAAPEFIIVLGGPQAPSLLAKDLNPPITLVLGEIEGVEPSFYTDLISKKLTSLYVCESTPLFDFPYTDDDFENQLKNRNIYYESSRGCPFSCSYCLSSISKGINSKVLSTVQKELSIIIEQKPTVVRFVDRTFNADPKRALQIWSFILEKTHPSSCYHFEIAPDIFTEEMFTFLETVPSGLFQFEIGIQSINADTLKAVNRKMDIEKAFITIKRLLSFNTIHLHIDLILGLPNDSQQGFQKSFSSLFKLQPHYIQMGLLKVLPDTGIEASSDEYSIKYCTNPPYQVLSTKWMNHAEIRHLYLFGECFESFYNTRYFKTFFRYINESDRDCFSFFEELLELCVYKNFFSLAKTQAFMNDILLEYCRSDSKSELLEEILIYDWLSCGHRFLPTGLNGDLTAARNDLYKTLPEKIEDLYDQKNRNFFFKKNVFYTFSGAFLNFVGLAKNSVPGSVVFLDKEEGLLKKNKCLLLS